ncbi:MAG: hypothetical protein AAB496_01270 [Patescibacteria group bacterium]
MEAKEKKISNLTSLISGVWQKIFTPQEALYLLRKDFLCEINKNGEEELVLDYLSSVERHEITVNDFAGWINKEFNKRKEIKNAD